LLTVVHGSLLHDYISRSRKPGEIPRWHHEGVTDESLSRLALAQPSGPAKGLDLPAVTLRL
jgi:hypothetical protein